MDAAEALGAQVGLPRACTSLGVARATLYRRRARAAAPPPDKATRPAPPLKLSSEERAQALALLHGERFIDASPYTLHATLLDEGRYLCSVRTFYRILKEHGEVRERRRQLQHPNYAKPELLASAPNQLCSWDITKLKGPAKWTYFYLYVILDVFSRCVVGWMLATRESQTLAEQLIAETCAKQQIEPGRLTLHADRGPSMTSKPVALLLADLGVTKSHSRPYVSDDNPFSEAQFKTLKYRPDFPQRFGCIEDARAHCQAFFCLVQHRTPPLRHRLYDPRRRPLRSHRTGPQDPLRCPRRRLCGQPDPLQRQTSDTSTAASGGLDQSAYTTRARRQRACRATLISPASCLKSIDTFRRGESPEAAEAICRAHPTRRQAIRVGVMARRGSAPQGARRVDAVTPERGEPGPNGCRRAQSFWRLGRPKMYHERRRDSPART